jgi:hypothetical protein
MTILALTAEPMAVDVDLSGSMLRVTLEDGREIAAPLAWFPRLRDASAPQQQNWRLIGRGEGIHWPDIDEDISIEGLLAGRAPKPSRDAA